MAERGVFICKDTYPFFEEVRVQFDWFPGFALSQQRKSQISLHSNFLAAYPEQKVLEVSSASLYSLGAALSAMHLKKCTKAGVTSVESAFQASRIYGIHGEIGPFPDYLLLPGKECKKLVKEKSQGLHSYGYLYEGSKFHAPAHFISLFYNFLYLNALCEKENKDVAEMLLSQGYTAFTDLATLSLNCQARSAAIFVSLVRNGQIGEVMDYDSYLHLFRTNRNGSAIGPESYENVQLLDSKGAIQLLSPVVPCSFTKSETEKYYTENCSRLSNKKNPCNYVDKAYQLLCA